MLGSSLPGKTRSLMGWFGIRGLGSIYYLTYALGKGVKGDPAETNFLDYFYSSCCLHHHSWY